MMIKHFDERDIEETYNQCEYEKKNSHCDNGRYCPPHNKYEDCAILQWTRKNKVEEKK